MEIPGPRSDGYPGPSVCAGIVIAMLAMIILPTTITLQTVHIPAPEGDQVFYVRSTGALPEMSRRFDPQTLIGPWSEKRSRKSTAV
jgi:hypothetical protein